MAATATSQPDFWQTLGNTADKFLIESVGGAVPGSDKDLERKTRTAELQARLREIRASNRSSDEKARDYINLFGEVGALQNRQARSAWELQRAQLPTLLDAKQHLADINTDSQAQLIGAQSDAKVDEIGAQSGARVKEIGAQGNSDVQRLEAVTRGQKDVIETTGDQSIRMTNLLLPNINETRDKVLGYLNQQLLSNTELQREQLKTARLGTFISPIASLLRDLVLGKLVSG
jgi:hypothetical protein